MRPALTVAFGPLAPTLELNASTAGSAPTIAATCFW